ncbi:hypothetical protein BURK2_03219 [Burkholderiales bacterium]|nr:hypothetical protein BURK2_03219 [Burkholderiales bacterium]
MLKVNTWIRDRVNRGPENAGIGQHASRLVIESCSAASDPAWLPLRQALWPDTSPAEHLAEMKTLCAEPERYAQFLAVLENACASLRHRGRIVRISFHREPQKALSFQARCPFR